jgi:putative membrane protein
MSDATPGPPPPPVASADGDQAREHLANERTALAWARTSVTLIGLGFAVSRFGLFLRRAGGGSQAESRASTILGLALVATGLAAAAASMVRFLRARRQIRQGAFRAEAWPETALTAVTTALGAGVIAYLLVTD